MKTKGYKTVLFLSAILVISAIVPLAIADDTIVPIIDFIDPTPDDNEVVKEDYVVDNVSASNVTTSDDVFYDQVWLEWDGTNYTMSTTGRVTEGSSTKYIFDHTVTNLTNGTYVYKVHANVIKVNPDNTTEIFGVSETRNVTINITGGASFELQLDDDWNLISIPLEIDNTSINAVFPDANDGDELYAYENGWISATYYSNLPGWYGDLETVEPDKGYWYSATTAGTVTIEGTKAGTRTVSIAEGWNLIGYTRLNPANLSVVLSTNVTNEDELYTYNGDWISATYYSNLPGWYGDLETVEPDKGYWYSTTTAYTATIEGTEAGTRSVSIADGWNLIGYTNMSNASLSYLLANVTNEDELFAYDGGEWLKAKYYSGYGWDGILSTMGPGKGYWYNANAPFIWEY